MVILNFFVLIRYTNLKLIRQPNLLCWNDRMLTEQWGKKCLSCPLLLALSSNWINTYSMAVTFFTFYWKWMRKTFNSQPPSPVWLHYLWMTHMSIDGFSVTPSLDLAMPLLQCGAVHLHSSTQQVHSSSLCCQMSFWRVQGSKRDRHKEKDWQAQKKRKVQQNDKLCPW